MFLWRIDQIERDLVPEEMANQDNAKPKNGKNNLQKDGESLVEHKNMSISSNPVGDNKPDGNCRHNLVGNFMANAESLLVVVIHSTLCLKILVVFPRNYLFIFKNC